MVPPRSCDICIVAGDVQPPRGLPLHVTVVREGWLLQLAEAQEQVDVGPFLARQQQQQRV